MTREQRLSAGVTGAALVAVLALGGWASASAPRHVAASEGRLLQVRYEVRHEPAYVPTEATEATRLEVLNAQPVTLVEDGVLSAEAGAALRSQQAEDAARTSAALQAIRTEDARFDRETATVLDQPRQADGRAEDVTPS